MSRGGTCAPCCPNNRSVDRTERHSRSKHAVTQASTSGLMSTRRVENSTSTSSSMPTMSAWPFVSTSVNARGVYRQAKAVGAEYPAYLRAGGGYTSQTAPRKQKLPTSQILSETT